MSFSRIANPMNYEQAQESESAADASSVADLGLRERAPLHNIRYARPSIGAILELREHLLCELLLVARRYVRERSVAFLFIITRTSFPPDPEYNACTTWSRSWGSNSLVKSRRACGFNM